MPRAGRVYCFRCESAGCPHAEPETSLSVFAGYDAAGRPLWQELTQALITLRDARVDQLYADRPRALAAVQAGRDLRGEQLDAFGRSSKTYAVLGQAVAGYYPCPPAPDADLLQGERVAVTAQIVEARGEGGRIRLHLNTLARMPGGGALEEFLAAGWQPALDRAVAVTRRSVESLDAQVAGLRGPGRGDALRAALGRVPAILHRFCESVERGDRQGRRRTLHAEERRAEQRPVHKALDDARAAGAEKVFFDERAGTFMISGSKHRVHAFAPDGRHVTSFTLPPAGLAQRLRTRRWRPATPDEFAAFRKAAGASAGE